MRAISAPKEIHEVAQQLRLEGQTIGLVPTMGALHDGHLSLIRQSMEDNDRTIVSIFVNPLQFNKQEDLANYPKSIEDDTIKLAAVKVDYLFVPSAEQFYETKPTLTISFGDLESKLEGEFRPGHFGGVGIVVNKLLNLVQPTRAYFGLKDLQQFMIIRKMVEDLSIPVEILGINTIREASGLAMSSRNRRLSNNGLTVGANIYQGLEKARKEILAGEDLNEVKNRLTSFYSSVEGLEVEYLEILDPSNFGFIERYDQKNELAIFFAGYVENVRLIDNLYLRSPAAVS
ncbi:MAG: pantoate--beta-alanine ligase [Cyclobacteriaceae bacterium]